MSCASSQSVGGLRGGEPPAARGRRGAVVQIANPAGISNAQLDQVLEGLYPQLEAAGHDAAGLQ